MGRPKKFNREEVLEKAMPLFWKQGFGNTCLQDLEKVTGVNKSGLYSEFKDKEDLFLATLRHYLGNQDKRALLSVEPLGWNNIEKFLKLVVQPCAGSEKGCFAINSMRDVEQLSGEAHEILLENRSQLRRLLLKNIAAEKTKAPAEGIAEILSTFLSGLCIEQNLSPSKNSSVRKVEDFLRLLRAM